MVKEGGVVLGNYDVVKTGEESADNRLHIGTDREKGVMKDSNQYEDAEES